MMQSIFNNRKMLPGFLIDTIFFISALLLSRSGSEVAFELASGMAVCHLGIHMQKVCDRALHA